MTKGDIERLNVALEGRYRIERQLGEGGMATVYLAEDLKHKRKVALKVGPRPPSRRTSGPQGGHWPALQPALQRRRTIDAEA